MKIGKILRNIIIALFLLGVLFLAIRIIILEDKSTLKEMYASENAISSYAENGDKYFVGKKVFAAMSQDGYYSAYSLVYIEDKKELQLTVKYNDSLLNVYLEGASPENFEWSLIDKDGKTMSTGESVQSQKKYYYNYEKIIFENVEFTDDCEVYLKLEDKFSGYPFEKTEEKNYMIYVYTNPMEKYNLSKSEIESLSK